MNVISWNKLVFINVFRTLSNIYGGTFSENSQRLKAINYFYKESSA